MRESSLRQGREYRGSGGLAGIGRPWRVPLAVCAAGLPVAAVLVAYRRGLPVPGAPLVKSALPEYVEALPWFAHGLWVGGLMLLASSVLLSFPERARTRTRWLVCALAGATVLAAALAGAST